MKLFKKKNGDKIFVGVLVFFVFVFLATPDVQAFSPCNNALSKCAIDSLVAGLLSGPVVLSAYFAMCLSGYAWCQKYYY